MRRLDSNSTVNVALASPRMGRRKDLALKKKTVSDNRLKDGIGIVKGSKNKVRQRTRKTQRRDVSA